MVDGGAHRINLAGLPVQYSEEERQLVNERAENPWNTSELKRSRAIGTVSGSETSR